MLETLSHYQVFGVALFLGTFLGVALANLTMVLRDLHYRRLYEQAMRDQIHSEQQVTEWIRQQATRIRQLNETLTQSLN